MLSLNGSSVELLKGSDGRWHPRREDGSKVELLTSPAYSNGDDNEEYWKVTSTDGTQYWFGRHRLPGWSTNRPTTNSVLTVPVYGNNPGEPCYAGTFAASECGGKRQAWRWNLDYVQDVHGNTMSLWWQKETNYYAKNMATGAPVAYDRAGYVTRIDYGTDNRDNNEYAAASPYVENSPGRVEFTTQDRCLVNCTTKNATTWPDTPWDQECTSTTNPCLNVSPTFWTAKRTTVVTTKAWKAASSSYQPADSWTLATSVVPEWAVRGDGAGWFARLPAPPSPSPPGALRHRLRWLTDPQTGRPAADLCGPAWMPWRLGYGSLPRGRSQRESSEAFRTHRARKGRGEARRGRLTTMTKPKTFLYRSALADIEQRNCRRPSQIIDGLIARAKEGDTKSAVYLCDRIMGRTAGLASPPAEDRREPFTEEDYQLEQADREESRQFRRTILGSGAHHGASTHGGRQPKRKVLRLQERPPERTGHKRVSRARGSRLDHRPLRCGRAQSAGMGSERVAVGAGCSRIG